jgi:hypothetical protein
VEGTLYGTPHEDSFVGGRVRSLAINEQGGAGLCRESVFKARQLARLVDPHIEHNLSRYRGAEVRVFAGFEEFEIGVLPGDEDSRVAPSPTISLNSVLLECAKLIA